MNWFDLIVFIIICVAFGKGFFSGLVMQIASLAGLILGAVFAGKLAGLIAPWLIKFTDSPAHIVGPLSYIVAFGSIIVALFFAGKMLQSFVDALQMNLLNKFLGATFCCAKWLILFSIVLSLFVEFDKNKEIIGSDVRTGSRLYPYVIGLSQKAIPYLKFDWVKDLNIEK